MESLKATVFDFARYSELTRKFLAWERATLKVYEFRSRVESTVAEAPSRRTRQVNVLCELEKSNAVQKESYICCSFIKCVHNCYL